MTSEEKDQEWRNAFNNYGIKIKDGMTPDDIVNDFISKVELDWREEITKYLPQLSFMSFCGAKSTIKWLMDQVELKR